jgi:cell division protease FtsH
MDKKQHFSLWYFGFAMASLFVLQSLLFSRHVESFAYSDFRALLHAGKIQEVLIQDDTLSSKVRFSGQIENRWLATLLGWVAPAVVFVFIWSVFMRRMGGGPTGNLLELGKSKAKVFVQKQGAGPARRRGSAPQ